LFCRLFVAAAGVHQNIGIQEELSINKHHP
jgi:hypothetical protein